MPTINSTLYNKVQLTHYLKVNELFERKKNTT